MEPSRRQAPPARSLLTDSRSQSKMSWIVTKAAGYLLLEDVKTGDHGAAFAGAADTDTIYF